MLLPRNVKNIIMEKYDYLAAVKEDVREYISDNDVVVNEYNREEVFEQLNDECFDCDSITGNASSSYTSNAWKAEENLCHNLDLLSDALDDFGGSVDVLEKGAEWCDVTIRCYLLPQVVDEVITEIIEG